MMGLINWLIFVYIRIRIWLDNWIKTKKNRFDVCISNLSIPNPEINGALPSLNDWRLATPNLKRNENILLAGSNTWGSGISLQMKWRPNEQLNLSTLITQFTLECGRNKPIYDYEEVWTQSQDSDEFKDGQYLRKYSGQNIKLEVILPYRSYRIFFSGYMRDRETKNMVYIRFRSIIANCGKIYDFKEQYDSQYMARQFSKKRPNCGYYKALHELALQDRHEHSVQFRCIYTVVDHLVRREDTASSPLAQEEKIFCWGFHARHFIDKEFNEKLRCKRVLAYMSNGMSFHLGSIESTVNKFDPKQRVEFGYSCPVFQITQPIQESNQLNWDQVTRDTRQLEFRFKCDNLNIHVEPSDEFETLNSTQESLFFDLITNGKKGRGFILINDCMESQDDRRLVDKSVSDYTDQVHRQQKLIDLTYLEMESKKKQFDVNRPMVVSLDQQDCGYSSLCGAKASSLAQLFNYQLKVGTSNTEFTFKVPNGVVLTRYAYDSILELNPKLRQEERRLASIVCQGNQDQIKYESERFQRSFLPPQSQLKGDSSGTTLKIPQQLLDELEKAMIVTFRMNSINDTDKSFAVRSSSWGEDEDNMSAAGQLTTLLSIQGFDQLRDAILICFGSKYSRTNLEYKRQHGLPIDMPMAIVIQEMVECDKAGVMFTSNPTNGNELQLLITANYGLGESVVSAAADPDSVLVGVEMDVYEPNNLLKRQANHIQEVTVGKKKIIMTSDSIKIKQNKEYQLQTSLDGDQPSSVITETQQKENDDDSDVDLNKCCLEEEEIFKLARCGLKLAHYFRCQRDIEWGLKNGQLYLFQSRPITGLDTMNDFELLHEFSQGLTAEKEWLTRANIGEVLPFAARPLTVTYILRSWSIWAANRFITMKQVSPEQYYPQQVNEVNCINYFYFFIMRMSMTFCFGSGKDRPLIARALEISFFGHEVDEPELASAASELYRPRSILATIYYQIYAMHYRFFPNWMVNRVALTKRNFRRDILKHKYVKTSSMEDLHKQLGIVQCEGYEEWVAHIMIIMLSPEYNFTLTAILSKYLKDPTKIFACYSKLLSSCKDVFSAGVPRQIEQMSKTIGVREEHINSFLAMDDNEALKYITNDPKSELTKLFNKFMDDFGHRSYNEFELVSKPWRDEPEFVINMIKQSCRDQLIKLHKKVTTSDTSAPLKKGSALLEEMGVNLSLADRLYIDYHILPKCRQYLRIRERTKDMLIYNVDCLRDAVNMLAKELRQNCRIPDDDLLCYMSFEEVGRVVKRHEPGIVDKAQRRRRFIKKLDTWKYDEIISGHEFFPRHLIVDSEEAKAEKELMSSAPKIPGTPAGFGKVRGSVCIVNQYEELNKVKPGDILVTYSTDIAFSPIFPVIGGIITEIGGMISHGAVIAREYGLPSLIGVQNATSIFKQGEYIELDATRGHVLRLDKSSK